MFEFVQLRCFVAVAEELHFGRAAARLNMSQPPLSRHVQQLEHAIGVRLLDRSSRSARLTAAGRVLLVEARRILRLAEDAALAAKRVAGGDGGTMALGFIPASSYRVLPHLVSFASGEMPNVTLLLKEMVTADQVEALLAGRIDAGILRMPIDRRGLDTLCIQRDRFIVALPVKHRLAALSHPLSIQHLDLEPLVMFAPIESRYNYDLVSSIFRAANVNPRFVQYAREVHTMLALVGAGIGAALVPESAVNLNYSGVVLREVELQSDTHSEFTLVWKNNSDNPALRIFVDLVKNSFVKR